MSPKRSPMSRSVHRKKSPQAVNHYVAADVASAAMGSSMTSYSSVSADHGVTWSTPEMLRYEAGNEFDPNNPLSSGYLTTNQSYFGNSIIKLADGKLLTVVGDANTPSGPRIGGMCFTGAWNAATQDYQWTPSNSVSIASSASPWLSEPDAAQLKDGRVLVVWRGTNTSTTPGRKWYSVASSDGQRSARRRN